MTRIPNNWDGKARGKSAQTAPERAAAIELNRLFVVARAAERAAGKEPTPEKARARFWEIMAPIFKET